MPHRFEVISRHKETRAELRLNKLRSLGFVDVQRFYLLDCITISSDFSPSQLQTIADSLSNPVSQKIYIDEPFLPNEFTWAIEIGFHPGVTDNVGNTAREIILDLLNCHSERSEAKRNEVEESLSVYSSTLMLLDGFLSMGQVQKISEYFANSLIHSIRIKNRTSYRNGKGMGIHIPKVELKPHPQADEVNLTVSDEELLKIGKLGIVDRIDENGNEIRRGSLALDLDYLKTIQNYFKTLGRNPTDVELESLAQTWSEHCKHTIFAAQIDDIEDGIFKHYIKRATEEIRKAKGENDICVSVFHDNAGGIIFDENFVVTDKVETHNTPSALDPFGGAVTGILGVNRDTIGFGKGAKPILNRFGFCFGFPDDEQQLYRDKEKNNPLLLPKRIMEGVIEGVNVGGNCSGIPTPQGFLYFDERYKGKPLVFVGTVGLIPRTSRSERSEESPKSDNHSLIEKQTQVGDYIVMIGGRVGQDGIHGATFSSEALNEASPSTAVQIGDAITQKKLSDAIVKEARDLNLFNSITDNGAGGLSCSVAEMAKECGGCFVELEKVPTKYPNLPPWKIWISESQERMTLAIPKQKWKTFFDLMTRRGVEATIIGEFTNSGKCVVTFNGKEVMNVDLDFLHNGLPKKKLVSSNQQSAVSREQRAENTSITPLLHYSITPTGNSQLATRNSQFFQLLSHPNICSTEFVSQQYDHTVQGTTIISGLQGKGRVNGNASVIRPLFNSWKGVAVSQALYPHLTESNPYATAGITIDQAIRNLVAVGVSLNHIALLDNFCWCDPNNPERLFQLKETARGCYDFAVGFGTPFISGKDSMFNDFHGYNEQGNEVNISVLPTLLISSLGVVNDVRKCVTMDLKSEEDDIFLVGNNTKEIIPNISETISNCKVIEEAIDYEILSSSYAIGFGGIGIALTKMSIAGQLGIDVQLDEEFLFAETPSRFLVTVTKENVEQFSKIVTEKNVTATKLGRVLSFNKFSIKNLKNENVIETTVEELEITYKNTFLGF
ncbi:MAG: hypothetical protein KGZ58_03645 [Ignavibacteriales bacterium]|nr:hypothetical protein [Ignavibacteriales bacterium]